MISGSRNPRENSPNQMDPSGRAEVPERLQDIVRRRNRVLAPGNPLSWPIEFVSGRGAHLIDRDGRDYLDARNNVPCVGHAHPHVVDAVCRQIAAVNLDTRYLDEALVNYAERLLATFPEELSKLGLRCSGSEANDLAMWVARFYTGAEGIIVTRSAYHGVTRDSASFSPGMVSAGSPLGPNVRLIDPPDPRLVAPGATLAQHMRKQVRAAIDDLELNGYRLAALIIDTAYNGDGIFTHPIGYMKDMVEEVHAAGGVYIADEVQAGFLRLGESMWGFSRHGVTPDVVTIGKSMGDGLPISGVVFRPEVCAEFGQKVFYWSTNAGRAISVAAAAALLDVFKEENVQQRVLENGKALRDGLESLTQGSPHVVEVRGSGLFFGVELVDDAENLEPGDNRTEKFVSAMLDRRVLIGRKGKNVLKIKPPLAFSSGDVTRFLETFADVAKDLL